MTRKQLEQVKESHDLVTHCVKQYGWNDDVDKKYGIDLKKWNEYQDFFLFEFDPFLKFLNFYIKEKIEPIYDSYDDYLEMEDLYLSYIGFSIAGYFISNHIKCNTVDYYIYLDYDIEEKNLSLDYYYEMWLDLINENINYQKMINRGLRALKIKTIFEK